MDLDLRKLRYFVAVADQLHFGRAAEELHIAQPVLSRQIRALEQDLGASLFTRDRHGVALTDAGRQLLADAGPLLASAYAVRRRVSVAARGSQRLVVGFRAGIPVIPAARAFEARHPDVVVDVQRIEWDDQAPMLLDGRIDVGYVRLPIDEAGLRVAPLYTEPRVAVLPAGHRLAGKQEVTEADVAGEPLVWHADPSTQPTRRPHPDAGYLVRGVDETLEHVAAGRGISFLARSATVFYSHPDVTYVPIPDLAPDQVCLAMAASRTSPVVDDFFTAAQATAQITAECGNYEMWQLASGAASKRS
ncbi:LysR family transcriptional regulator [Streptomyces rapamycinicus]|uniref:LysR family transcriptional regulator n=2 Tax=Streptomyces rapamycinicus TaxID=1226757 RepID=A0A0A0NQD5_STRRN|nr:LysR substrate-binding domain-containing protein [Streptomyces rapamycinicus]AGP59426.1 LysR family transcriptional regulator [Streptomyces rapamycinicus NRRL 5491]MBB4787180.1 DNA-binding transcriptional LysR family regulator [Streptomyces rapamycinicus]RLV77381.1 LysR family transcriptional regulator [Streptomyces rapamycinicus NRRL 5491]UTO67143.1 LysR family transcriptional regulator [Streptomyces rapamycinicus]UTP35100.1 LysR family transcriptional regulator [Streptomyces rapamycinicus